MSGFGYYYKQEDVESDPPGGIPPDPDCLRITITTVTDPNTGASTTSYTYERYESFNAMDGDGPTTDTGTMTPTS